MGPEFEGCLILCGLLSGPEDVATCLDSVCLSLAKQLSIRGLLIVAYHVAGTHQLGCCGFGDLNLSSKWVNLIAQ